MAYAPRFHPCSSAECLAVGANIDLSDPATLGWIRSVDAKTADQVSFMLAGRSTGMGVLAGYLKGDAVKPGSSALLAESFSRYAVARGISPTQAARLSSGISAAGGWEHIVNYIRK